MCLRNAGIDPIVKGVRLDLWVYYVLDASLSSDKLLEKFDGRHVDDILFVDK